MPRRPANERPIVEELFRAFTTPLDNQYFVTTGTTTTSGTDTVIANPMRQMRQRSVVTAPSGYVFYTRPGPNPSYTHLIPRTEEAMVALCGRELITFTGEHTRADHVSAYCAWCNRCLSAARALQLNLRPQTILMPEPVQEPVSIGDQLLIRDEP